MRAIIEMYPQVTSSFFQPISERVILERIPILNIDILAHIEKMFHFDKVQQMDEVEVKMTKKSIARFVIAEMAISKKSYKSYEFDEISEEMLLIFMPAEAEITSQWLKQNPKDK